ncbi:divergent polysaccharide deacetylase family protein [Terrihabitans sp. B22-R8]|uniref:divergent polysaccharide deacetylase family protein n=1 Tax=Terrihabitans sp. B22-R8 TaxID=3425128 RepID=UPI00403CB8FB
MDDEFRTPLGMHRRPPRRFPRILPYLAAALLLLIVGAVLWAALLGDPMGGEPQAVATIEREPLAPPVPVSPERAARSGPPAAPVPIDDVITATEPASGPLIIRIPQNNRPGTGSGGGTDSALVEDTPAGPLPRIAPDGRRPLDVYARPAPPLSGRPRIALVVMLDTSMEGALARAMALPEDVGFALRADEENVEAGARLLRNRGRELLLGLPVQPFGEDELGPLTVSARLPATANLQRLAHAMGRFSGYIGLVNVSDGPLTAEPEALRPLLAEAGRRGLGLVDPGASANGRVHETGRAVGAPSVRAEFLAGDGEPAAAWLQRLELAARRDGRALGMWNTPPADPATIAEWAKSLSDRGFDLVPVSAMLRQQDPS